MQRRRGLAWLPNSIKSDPQAVEAFFALRDMCSQQRAWWRLVGVSGVAVCKAMGVRLQADAVASKSVGGARFARQLLRRQERRLLAEREALTQELRAAADEQLAARDAAHAAVVEQHLQRQEQQAVLILEQSNERAELKSQLRKKNEAIAANEAVIAKLEGDVSRVEQGARAVEQEFAQYRQQIAKEQGWKEALQHKVQEVSGGTGPLLGGACLQSLPWLAP